LAARFAQHPTADRGDHAGFLGQWNERRWGKHAAPWMNPAHERLELLDSAIGHGYDRLKVELELVVFQCTPQICLELESLQGALLHKRIEHADCALAVHLGAVHRHIGFAEDAFGVFWLALAEHDANAAADDDLVA
jgi:hypothetical protein